MRYTPILEEHILTLIIDKLLKIDLEIQVELDDLDEINDTKDEKNVDQNGDSVDEESEFEFIQSSNIKEMVDKMDTLMDVVIQYVKSIKNHESKECLSSLFQSLLYIFEKIVVNTHKSKYTQ